MANVTFSKKGVPMGRNKSQADNKNSQWSEAEDNYIRMAIEKGTCAGTVASKLGRTEHSVKNRKWILGIEGRFPSAKGKGIKTIKTPSSTTSQMVTEKAPKGMQLFQMESNVPLPSGGRSANEETRNRMRSLFSQMNVGQSFVVPQKMVHVAKYITDKEFPAYKIKTSATSQDKKFHRIYRVA
jgi:hypothetical protein